MQKETLTLSGIAHDLNLVANFRFFIVNDRYSYILAIGLLGIIAAIFTKIWIGLVILCFAIYPTICFVRECQKDKRKRAAIESIILRGDVSISIKELSHISQETIYEPHRYGKRRYETKTVQFFYFVAGSSWRVPEVAKHYEWSKEYYISTKGLENISLPGDRFFYVSLQGYPDISYIYPCKTFVLDSTLKNEEML